MNRRGRLGIYLPALIISILATVTLRTIACFLFYDTRTGYFDSKTLINVTSCILFAAIFFLLTHIFFSEHGRTLLASFSGPETYVPTGLVTAALIFFSAHSLRSFLLRGISIGDFFSRGTSSAKMTAAIELMLAILAILAAAHFILTAILTERASVLRAGFGICASAFFALIAIYLYFDTSLPINAPCKISEQMAYLFIALFLIYEIRISLGRELWAAYRTFGLIAALLSAYSSLPALIYYIAGSGELSSSIYSSVLMLTLFVFIMCRLILSSRIKEDCDRPSVAKLRSASELRRAEVESRELLSKAARELEKVYDSDDKEDFGTVSGETSASEEQSTVTDTADFEPIQLTFYGEAEPVEQESTDGETYSDGKETSDGTYTADGEKSGEE